MTDTASVYALVDPRTDEVRYVGFSHDPDARLRWHLAAAKRLGPGAGALEAWLNELEDAGVAPEVRILATGPEDEMSRAEGIWAVRLRAEGHGLCNRRDEQPWRRAAQRPDAPSPTEIRALRKRLGLSQAELGARLGASPNSIARWERPADDPHRRTPTGLYLRELRRLMDEAGGEDRTNEG